jgi:hypothetical protein
LASRTFDVPLIFICKHSSLLCSVDFTPTNAAR